MATVESGKVKIRSVQAIKYIEFDMPPNQGGIRVFLGSNGAGKTTAIRCLESLMGRKVPLEPSDDSPDGTGEVEGFGVKQKIGKRVKTTGELEAATLEGFEFSDLVDPPVKDPDARNRTRIKALVGLAGKKCSAEDFRELFEVPEEFDSVVDVDELDGVTDALALAAAVKKSAESTARGLEAEVEDDAARWKLAVEQSKGASVDQPPKAVSALADEYAAAKDRLETARAQNAAREAAIDRNAATEKAIAEHEGVNPGGGLKDFEEMIESVNSEISDLEKKLKAARERLDVLHDSYDDLAEWHRQKDRLAKMIVQVPESVDESALEEAAESALEALQQAEEKKSQYEAAGKAKTLAAKIKANKAKAERLRTVAKSVGTVISRQLPDDCLLVPNEDGMLGVHYEKRGHWIPMDELSEGEKFSVCLPIALKTLGSGAVVPLRQESWQALDTSARKEIAKICKELKIWLVSGQVADCELRVESY